VERKTWKTSQVDCRSVEHGEELEKTSQVDCRSVETWRGNLKKPLR